MPYPSWESATTDQDVPCTPPPKQRHGRPAEYEPFRFAHRHPQRVPGMNHTLKDPQPLPDTNHKQRHPQPLLKTNHKQTKGPARRVRDRGTVPSQTQEGVPVISAQCPLPGGSTTIVTTDPVQKTSWGPVTRIEASKEARDLLKRWVAVAIDGVNESTDDEDEDEDDIDDATHDKKDMLKAPSKEDIITMYESTDDEDEDEDDIDDATHDKKDMLKAPNKEDIIAMYEYTDEEDMFEASDNKDIVHEAPSNEDIIMMYGATDNNGGMHNTADDNDDMYESTGDEDDMDTPGAGPDRFLHRWAKAPDYPTNNGTVPFQTTVGPYHRPRRTLKRGKASARSSRRAYKGREDLTTRMKSTILSEHVGKITTRGSIRHQRSVTREINHRGEKRTVKTWVEITNVYEVPHAHTLKWEDVADAEATGGDGGDGGDGGVETETEALLRAIGRLNLG